MDERITRTLEVKETELNERAAIRWRNFKECKDMNGKPLTNQTEVFEAYNWVDEAVSSSHVFDMHREITEQFTVNMRKVREMGKALVNNSEQ